MMYPKDFIIYFFNPADAPFKREVIGLKNTILADIKVIDRLLVMKYQIKTWLYLFERLVSPK